MPKRKSRCTRKCSLAWCHGAWSAASTGKKLVGHDFEKIAKRLGSFAGFSRPRWHLCMWCNASPIWKKIAHTCEAGCKRKPRNCQQQQGPNQNDTNREHHQQKGTWCSCSIRSVCFSLPHAALSFKGRVHLRSQKLLKKRYASKEAQKTG